MGCDIHLYVERKVASGFWAELIPRLTSLALREQLAYPDVRITFWFDN